MGGAQESAKAAKDKATMDQMRAAAALYSTSHNNVIWKDGDAVAPAAPATEAELISTACAFPVTTENVDIEYVLATNPNGHNFLDDGEFKTLCSAAGATVVADIADATAWCAKKTLAGGGTWCVDSTGYAGATATGCTGTAAGDSTCQ
jgi:hypothetical protein